MVVLILEIERNNRNIEKKMSEQLMENNEKEKEYYYRVYLNGPDELFYTYKGRYNIEVDKSRIKVEVPELKYKTVKKEKRKFFGIKEYYEETVPYMGTEEDSIPIYCKSVDDKMIDIITGYEYTWEHLYGIEKFERVTYSREESVDLEVVYRDLKKLDQDMIKSYVNKIDNLICWTHAQYLSSKAKEKKYQEFIDDFFNNHNTKTRKK